MYFFSLFFFSFGYTMQLAGSQLPDQGLNLAVKTQNPKHQTTRELPGSVFLHPSTRDKLPRL